MDTTTATTPATTNELEALAAEYEARMAAKEMWRHGFPRCPLTRYADAAGRLADRLTT